MKEVGGGDGGQAGVAVAARKGWGRGEGRQWQERQQQGQGAQPRKGWGRGGVRQERQWQGAGGSMKEVGHEGGGEWGWGAGRSGSSRGGGLNQGGEGEAGGGSGKEMHGGMGEVRSSTRRHPCHPCQPGTPSHNNHQPPDLMLSAPTPPPP